MPTVRPARASDIPTVLGIWAASDAEPTVTDDESSLRRLLHRDPHALLVVEVEEAVVGRAGATGLWRAAGYRAQTHRLRFVKNTPPADTR